MTEQPAATEFPILLVPFLDGEFFDGEGDDELGGRSCELCELFILKEFIVYAILTASCLTPALCVFI